jgi:hypothetical protein
MGLTLQIKKDAAMIARPPEQANPVKAGGAKPWI